MNERIEKLALQAGMHRDKFGMYFAGDKHNEDGVDLEKFAELILQDVLKVVDGKELLPYFDARVETEPEDPIGKGWWRKQETIKSVIKERYGVE